MFSIPATSSLLPQRCTLSDGSVLYILQSESTELVKLDFLYEAGSAYQPQMLCAAVACKLHILSGGGHTAAQLSEFLDYRGVIVEASPDVLQSTVTVYFLRRYAEELLPVLVEVMEGADFPLEEFDVYRRKRKHELLAAEQKTNEVARRLFYQGLFGSTHPLGRHAVAADADCLQLDTVKAYYRSRFLEGGKTIVMAGNVDEKLIQLVERCFSRPRHTDYSPLSTLRSPLSALHSPLSTLHSLVPGAVQSTVRVGRVLPMRWDDMDYARFMLLTTVLGGYFGSRLMQNLREERGLTYGVYARTQIYRGCIVFYAAADVAGDKAEEAEKEIFKELKRLAEEEMDAEELALAKRVMVGDFLRSVDGIFERSARLCDMIGASVDETLTDNLRTVLQESTPSDLQSLSQSILKPEHMLSVYTLTAEQ